MRHILNIIIICSFVTMSAYADMTQYNKSFGQTDYDEMTSDRAVMNSTRYSSPIYEPFSNSTPSEQTEIGSGQSKPNGHIRKGFDVGGDAGQGPSPIGDAVLPMILALAVYCAVRVYRRKRRA
ncbi:MAG: hypothetical protein IKS76_00445 [Paludibacteraceae bacterium]|nr:hypothetical protein [Paludibacteraceae bacterium]